jgi:hypothetical protein
MPRDTKAPAAGGASESMAKPNSCWLRASPAVQALAGRWTLAVLAELANGGRRYQDLLDALDGVSHKVLIDTLRRAERDGLVAPRPALCAPTAEAHPPAPKVPFQSGRIR